MPFDFGDPVGLGYFGILILPMCIHASLLKETVRDVKKVTDKLSFQTCDLDKFVQIRQEGGGGVTTINGCISLTKDDLSSAIFK
jgi:hypothetical protein